MLASDLKKIKMHGHPREKGISNLNQRHPITLRFGSLSWALNWGWRLHDACFVENSSNGICWLCSYREPIPAKAHCILWQLKLTKSSSFLFGKSRNKTYIYRWSNQKTNIESDKDKKKFGRNTWIKENKDMRK
jgi:hypothetical protein